MVMRANSVYFGPVATRPHFAAALAATFDDLRQACVAPGSGWTDAVTAVGPANGGSPAKAADLDLLYQAYCHELQSLGVLDNAAVLLAAAGATGGHGGHTMVYGIYDLNQAQETFVASLLSGGADAFVPVPRGGLRTEGHGY